MDEESIKRENICFKKEYSIRNPEDSIKEQIDPDYYDNIKKIKDYLKPNEMELLKLNDNKFIIPGNNIILDESSAIEYIKKDIDIKELYNLGYILKLSSFSKFCTLTDLIQFGYNIKITNRCSYHLINDAKIIYIKPLPTWITDGIFIEKILNINKNKEHIIPNINGFLTSYEKLIKSKTDFQYAIELKLIDDEMMTWNKWQQLFYNMKDSFGISRRYCYQILNMTNINIIYFVINFKIIYSGLKTNFTDFIINYYIIGIAFFAFCSIFLSIAQVIMSLPMSEEILLNWSNLFYPFSIIMLIILFCIIILIILTCLSVFISLIIKYLKREFILKKWETEDF